MTCTVYQYTQYVPTYIAYIMWYTNMYSEKQGHCDLYNMIIMSGQRVCLQYKS